MEKHIQVIDINRTVDFVKYLCEKNVNWYQHDGRIYVDGVGRVTFYNEDFEHSKNGMAYLKAENGGYCDYITEEGLKEIIEKR